MPSLDPPYVEDRTVVPVADQQVAGAKAPDEGVGEVLLRVQDGPVLHVDIGVAPRLHHRPELYLRAVLRILRVGLARGEFGQHVLRALKIELRGVHGQLAHPLVKRVFVVPAAKRPALRAKQMAHGIFADCKPGL